jgi:outer membrane protein TolC
MRSTVFTAVLLSAAISAPVVSARPRVAQQQKDDDDQDGSDRENEGDGPEAQAYLPISLDKVIEVVVQLAPDLMRARVDRVAAREAAGGARRDQAWVATSGVEHTRNAVAERVETPLFSQTGEVKTTGSLGLGRRLPTGGSLDFQVGVTHSVTEFNVPDSVIQALNVNPPAGTNANGEYYETQNRDFATLKATLKQPLARGFGPKVALAQEKKADLAATEATVKAQLAGEEIVRDVVIAYWELAYQAEEVNVRQQALDLARKQEQLTHEQMRAGSVPSTALNAVTYEIQLRSESLLRAQLELEKSSLELRRKAGLEIGRRDVIVRPGDPFTIGDEEFDVDDILARSHQANRKLATVQLEKKIADLDLAVADDQTKPQLDLTLSGGLIGQGDGTANAINAITEGYEVTVGVNLSFEISGAARRNRDAARARRKRLDIDRQDLERQIDTEVVTAVHAVTAARTRVALADKAEAVAEENVRAERASFMANRTTNFQVMQRQTELVESRLRRARAIADWHRAVAQLQFLSGIILEQYRVDVRPSVATEGSRRAGRDGTRVARGDE